MIFCIPLTDLCSTLQDTSFLKSKGVDLNIFPLYIYISLIHVFQDKSKNNKGNTAKRAIKKMHCLSGIFFLFFFFFVYVGPTLKMCDCCLGH
ncbi:hypothetical protein CLU79DRAFT_764371 [Phycomyces nitens]|nr:hypothetical protein CLU79DRAFT_764371 [Phycomyces nitens]